MGGIASRAKVLSPNALSALLLAAAGEAKGADSLPPQTSNRWNDRASRRSASPAWRVPLQDRDSALRELEFVLQKLISPRGYPRATHGGVVGDARFEPFFAAR